VPPLGRALVHVVNAVPLDSASGQYLAACCMFHNLTAAKATSRVTHTSRLFLPFGLSPHSGRHGFHWTDNGLYLRGFLTGAWRSPSGRHCKGRKQNTHGQSLHG